MTTSYEELKSKYLNFLPNALVDVEGKENTEAKALLQNILKAFEAVLTGFDDDQPALIDSLYSHIEIMENYFDPETTPKEFLDYIAGWVALSAVNGDFDTDELLNKVYSLNCKGEKVFDTDDIGETESKGSQLKPLPDVRYTTNRYLIKNAVQHYKIRGTKTGLKELLNEYTSAIGVSIQEIYEFVDEQDPFYFELLLVIDGDQSNENFERIQNILIPIIEQEKPAHTHYGLRIQRMQIGYDPPPGVKKCVIGESTYLGGIYTSQNG